MKREAFRHPKTLDLAARLSLPHAYAFAHVCYLLNAAADIAPQGDIGKWPDGVIARSGEWTGKPEQFVEALVGSGWLDRHSEPRARLLIHDWPDHCERFVRSKLARERTWFHWSYYADGTRKWDAPEGIRLIIPDPNLHTSPSVLPSAVATTDVTPPCDPTQPNPTQPNPTKPSAADAADSTDPPQTGSAPSDPEPPASDPAALPLPHSLAAEPFPAAWAEWLAYRRERRASSRERTLRAQLESLAPLGPIAAAECIHASIRNGWIGLFPEKGGKRGDRVQPARVGSGQRFRG